MRHIISTALVAVVVSLVTVTAVGTLAQSPAQGPAAEPIIAPAVSNINAHKVDGKHAVGAKASRAKRAGKLVATNKAGYLPANIVKPAWKLIAGKPAAFRDGQIGWDEIAGKPADPKITLTTHSEFMIADTTGIKTLDVACPTGKVTGGGFYDVNGYAGNYLIDSYASNAVTWRVRVAVNATVDTFYAYATCMTAEPATLVARLTPAARNPMRDR